MKKIMETSDLNIQLKLFGKKMFLAAILSIVSIASESFALFALYVVLYIAVKDLKRLDNKIQDRNLTLFIKRISISAVISFISGIILIISVVGSMFTIIRNLISSVNNEINALIFLSILLFTLISDVISYGIQIKAWNHLYKFFYHLTKYKTYLEAEEGAIKLKKANIAMIISTFLGILFVILGISSLFNLDALPSILEPPVFFGILFGALFLTGIPLLIGHITMIQGYFSLADLKKLEI